MENERKELEKTLGHLRVSLSTCVSNIVSIENALPELERRADELEKNLRASPHRKRAAAQARDDVRRYKRELTQFRKQQGRLERDVRIQEDRIRRMGN